MPTYICDVFKLKINYMEKVNLIQIKGGWSDASPDLTEDDYIIIVVDGIRYKIHKNGPVEPLYDS